MTRFIQLMRAPGIYFRIFGATFGFSIIAYLHYRSVTLTLYYSVICMFLMQVGYIGGVLFLIWREGVRQKIH